MKTYKDFTYTLITVLVCTLLSYKLCERLILHSRPLGQPLTKFM